MRSAVLPLAASLLVSCGGRLSSDGSDGGAGAPGQDSSVTRLAVRQEGQLSVLEFSDPAHVRRVPLAVRAERDPLWRAELGNSETKLAWSPDGAALAWSNEDGSAGVYAEGRVLWAPSGIVSPFEETYPSVRWLNDENLLLNHDDDFFSWQPTTGQIEWSSKRSVEGVAGGGYVACEDDRYTFVSASGKTVTWERRWIGSLHPEGERLALVVPEAGASGLDPALIDEIVVPEATGEAVGCDPLPNQPLPEILVLGPVQWSASGRRLGVRIIGGEEGSAIFLPLRTGSSPLQKGADEDAPVFSGSSRERPWYFRGEDVYWIGSVTSERSGESVLGVRRRSESGTVTTLGEAEPGDDLMDSKSRPGGRGEVFLAEHWTADAVLGPTFLYVLNQDDDFRRLDPAIDPRPDLLLVRPQPDGPGVAVFFARQCYLIGPCDGPQTLVWPDPDLDPNHSVLLSGEAHWLPGRDALVLALAPDLWLVDVEQPDERIHLGTGDEVLVSPRPPEAP